MEVCIVKDTMGVEQNKKLKFKRSHEHHPF